MGTEAQVRSIHKKHSHAQFFFVWGALLLMTGIEIFLAYQHLPPVKMLGILLGLSVVKAALIIAYFMHLKFEYTGMKIMLMTALVVCLCLMSAFFPDAVRLLKFGVR